MYKEADTFQIQIKVLDRLVLAHLRLKVKTSIDSAVRNQIW